MLKMGGYDKLLIHFLVTAGEVHDCKEAPELVAELPEADYFIADKGYCSEGLRTQIKDKGAISVIQKRNAKTGNDDIDLVSLEISSSS